MVAVQERGRMIIKLMSMNLWNYHFFEERLPKIIALIKKENPDIIALQEVRDDSRKNKKGNNQLSQLNKRLGYRYHHFFGYMDVNEVNKKLNNKYYDPTNPKVIEGLGFLSRYPIIKAYNKHLKRHKHDAYPRGIICAKFRSKKIFDIFIVHFSADDIFSRLHLEETLKYAEERNVKPIIVGDLNIRKTQIAHELASKEYIVSSDEFKYYSYPSKQETLDYIFIPKSMRFKSFKCKNSKVSDHSVLLAEIEV
jgi:endonuclease/exonuclease/phosphatase family metal-dependent hydrolase